MNRLRIHHRINLLVLGVIVPFALITFVVVERRLTREAQRRLTEELDAARATFEEVRADRRNDLLQTARLVAELPYFKAAVAVYDPAAPPLERADQVNTIVPAGRDIMRSVNLDYLAVLGDSNAALVTLRGPREDRDVVLDAATRALRDSVLAGRDGTGDLVAGDQVYQVALEPMLVDGNLFGTLLVGRRIDQAMADRLRDMTHTDILVAADSGLVAMASADSSTARAVAAAKWLRPGAAVTPAFLDHPKEVRLAGERYLTLTRPIVDPTGRTIGAFVLQRSLDEALRYVSGLRRMMLAIWGAALVAAVLLSTWLAGHMSRPIHRLVEVTKRVAGGDFTQQVPATGGRELSGLARAFNQMSRGLARTLEELAATNRRLAERGAELEQRNRELQETQAQLIQAGKLAAIGELGAGLAHELNQPLTSVKGFAQVLLARLGPDSPHRKQLAHIEHAADHMARIVRGLRDFSRQSKGEQQRVDLNRVFEDSLVLVEAQLRKQGVTLELDLAADLPAVLGDPNQLQQVLTNLMTNARDALEGAPVRRLRLVTRARGGCVVARVEDTGSGIPAGVRARMFQSFFTTKEAGKGTGLGLSISRGIAENHGGRLGVHSRVGVGTTFWLVLPAADAAEQRKAA